MNGIFFYKFSQVFINIFVKFISPVPYFDLPLVQGKDNVDIELVHLNCITSLIQQIFNNYK